MPRGLITAEYPVDVATQGRGLYAGRGLIRGEQVRKRFIRPRRYWAVPQTVVTGTTTTDSDTVSLLFTVSSTEAVDFVDQQTVLLDLQPSGTEAADFVDADAPYLDLQPIATFEEHTTFDAATVYLDLRVLPAYKEVVLVDNAVAYYRMDETSGQPQDTTLHLLHTTATIGAGTAVYQSNGALVTDSLSKSILLDGNKAFTSPDNTLFDLGNNFSLEAWIRRSATGSYQCIVTKGGGAYEMRINSNDRLALLNNSVAQVVESTQTITDVTSWHHVVATKNGTTSKLYIDGVDVTGVVTDSSMGDNTDALIIGSETSGSITFGWNGYLDEVAIYNYALSPAQVLSHFDAGTRLPEFAQFVDSATVYFDLQPSGTEIAGFVDSATIPLLFTPSTVDVAQFVDSATAVLLFTPSGVDVVERIVLDAATIPLLFTPSGVDTAQFVDGVTVPLLFTPSGSDIIGAVEQQSVYLDLQPSTTTEIAQFVDSATVPLLFTPSTSDIAQFVDSSTVPLLFTPSGADIILAVEAATVRLSFTPSAVLEEHTTFDVATVPLLFTPSTTFEEHALFDAASIYLDLQPSTTAEEHTTNDATTVPLLFTTTSSDIAQLTDAATVALLFTPSTADIAEYVDAASVYFDLQPSTTTEVAGFVDAATAPLLFSFTTVDIAQFTDADAPYLDLQPSGTDSLSGQSADSATIPLLFTPTTTTEQAQYVDSAQVYFDLQPSTTVEVVDFVDAATASLTFSVTSVDVADFVDSASVYFDLQPSGTEQLISTAADNAVVYLDLQVIVVGVSAFDDFNRANGGLGSNWTPTDGSTLIISSNKVTNSVATTGPVAGAIRNSESYQKDQYSSIELTSDAFPSGAWIGAFVRSDINNLVNPNFYLGIYFFSNPSYVLQLYKRVGSVFTQLTNTIGGDTVGLGTSQAAAGTPLKVSVVGTTVTLSFAGVDRIVAVDSAIANGLPGFMTTSNPFLDNWLGGDAVITDIAQFVDSSTVYLAFTPSAAEAADFTDQQSVYFDLQPSGTDQYVPPAAINYTDADTAFLDLQPSGAEVAGFVDSASVPLLFTPSGVDTAQFLDSATQPLRFSVTSAEALDLADFASVYLDLQPSTTVETTQYIDAATTNLQFTVTATEGVTYSDTAVVYLDLQVIIFVAPTMDLVIVGLSRRWVLTTERRFTAALSMRWVKKLTVRKRFELQEAVRWKFLSRIP